MIAQSRPFGQRYAFVVVAVIFLSLLIAAGLRSAPSVMMLPLENDFGWRRDVVSLAAAIGIFLYGMTGAADLAGLIATILDPYLLAAFAIYGIGTIVWVYVLKSVPLTVAYPFMAMTFCVVPLLAWGLLGEALTLRYMLGTALIVGGLIVINA